MSEATRRYGYAFDRVLIESERILSPVGDDAVLYITSAQLEMLRNITQYLRRTTSYVDTYEDGYYLIPDATDMDDILAVVADLEETLMGNPNTLFGYAGQWFESLGGTKTGDGTYQQDSTTVPEGYIYRPEFLMIVNRNGDRGYTRFAWKIDGAVASFAATKSPADDIDIYWSGTMTLKEGDGVRVQMDNCLDGDVIRAYVIGYKMIVPE